MSAPPGGIPGLDRKAMEEERLARLGKKRSVPPGASQESRSKAPRLDANQQAKVNLIPKSPLVLTEEEKKKLAAIRSRSSLFEFPMGAIRRTWAFGHERHNDIKIEEVLRRKDLKTAVISSFNWDFDWLATKFEPQTKLVFVMQARNDAEKKAIQDDFQGLSTKIRLCFPPMSGYAFACMHSKLMLLFYKTHLRIVVPSANFVPYDWGETGIMENSVFLIDLVRLGDERLGHENDTLTPFARELLRFLDASQVHEDVQLGLLNFDFTFTRDIQFVHTIGGVHIGPASKYTGFPGLSRAVRALNCQTSPDIDLQVDMAASSVGAVDQEFMNSLYRSVRGFEPIPPASPKSKNAAPSASGGFVAKPENFRIIFPSRETVQQSTGGPRNGGTIFLKPEYYKRPKFPSKNIRDYKSRRRGLLSHNKLIFSRSPNSAFLYHGSANLSQAAWGKLTYDKETKGPKLSATNWECGVLLPAHRSESSSKDSPDGDKQKGEKHMTLGQGSDNKHVLSMDTFENVLGVPFEYPAKAYEDGQLPWNAGTIL